MLKSLYELIDKAWQRISSLVFVRFAFDIPVETYLQNHQPSQLVFSLTHGGLVDWLILSSWSRKNGLGAILVSNRKRILLFSKPLYFFQIVFFKRTYSDLFLSEEKGPRLIFCPPGERKQIFNPTDAEQLIAALSPEAQRNKKPVLPFLFIPVFICWRKHLRGSPRQLGEYFLGLSSKPNIIGKLWYLIRKRTDSTVKGLEPISFTSKEPAEIGDELDGLDSTRLARMVRRRILIEVNQEIRVALGPRYSSPYLIKENIMRDPQLLQMIEQIATESGVDRKKVMAQAYSFLTEISANYTFRFIEMMYVVLTWLFGKIFEDIVVDPQEVQQLRDTLKNRSAVFVSCHRSHLDYLVVPGVLFLQDIVTPHIAAGVNLSFWPVGHFLRMGGAFFIRRSFRGEPLYALCLQKYIDWLIKNRINIKFFIEGTRSRTGKMLPPAYGLLKMVLNSFQLGQIDDLALVPISISYDEVLEEGSYGKELAGAQKTRESTKGLVQSRKLFKRNIGKVYVRFAPPISLKMESEERKRTDLHENLFLQKLAFHLCKAINDVTPVTPKSILASILLSHQKSQLSLEEILRTAKLLADYVLWSHSQLSTGENTDELKRAIEIHIKKLLASETLTGFATMPSSFGLESRSRINMVFYKNNAIHCLVIPSIAVLSCLRAVRAGASNPEELTESTIRFATRLRNIFKFEFFFSPTLNYQTEIRETLTFLTPKILQQEDASVFLRLNRDIIESYLIAFETMKKEASGTLEHKFLLQKMVREAVNRVEGGTLFNAECVSTQNLSNACKLMENMTLMKIIREGERVMVEYRGWDENAERTLQELYECHQTLLTPLPFTAF
ncbi:hypothetical protein EBQ90_12655 [bacterium]|nr:hypothetical protein [bacterium]